MKKYHKLYVSEDIWAHITEHASKYPDKTPSQYAKDMLFCVLVNEIPVYSGIPTLKPIPRGRPPLPSTEKKQDNKTSTKIKDDFKKVFIINDETNIGEWLREVEVGSDVFYEKLLRIEISFIRVYDAPGFIRYAKNCLYNESDEFTQEEEDQMEYYSGTELTSRNNMAHMKAEGAKTGKDIPMTMNLTKKKRDALFNVWAANTQMEE